MLRMIINVWLEKSFTLVLDVVKHVNVQSKRPDCVPNLGLMDLISYMIGWAAVWRSAAQETERGERGGSERERIKRRKPREESAANTVILQISSPARETVHRPQDIISLPLLSWFYILINHVEKQEVCMRGQDLYPPFCQVEVSH